MPALALVMASSSAFAAIDYHRLVWDADPAHQAVIGFSQSNSEGTATVKYGYSTDENTWLEKAVSNSQDFDGTNFTSSFVRLTGLTENSAVYYRVCEGSSCGDRLWFKTAATDNSPFVMLAGGDTRTGWSTRKLGNELLAKIRPLFIMHGGDFTSANNANQMKEFFKDWQLTFSNDTIDGIAYKRIYPLVPTFGNHEDGDYSTLCKVFGVDYNDNGVCSDDDTYGAFDISPLLRVYTLNSEYKNSGWSTQATAQANWLASDLTANSDKVSWRFAQYHKPIFPHSTTKVENPTLFTWWANEFYNNKVNLAFESDTHLSKITQPVIPVGDTFQVTATGGTVYAGEGSWGAPARSANKNYSWTLENESIQQFKVLTISSDKVEMRTAQFDSGASTNVSTISAQERANDATVLPAGVDWWGSNDIGNVITLTRSNNELSLLTHADDTSSGGGTNPVPPSENMVLDVVADTFISQTLLNQNFNAVTDQLLADGNDGTYGPMKILLAWDLSTVETCNVVTAASVELQVFNASPGTYEVYSSVTPWIENEVTWSSFGGTESQGTLMSSFMPDTMASHTVALSAEGISAVQEWITQSNSNNGLVITSADTNDGIDVEDREQGVGAKLTLTLDNSACEEAILVNGSSFVSQSVPSAMIVGETMSVNVTMNNAGTSTWTAADGHKLGSQNAQGNTTWGFNRVQLSQDVAPGDDVSFSFDVTAPSTAGTYEFQWKMLQESVQWFGATSTNVTINVSEPLPLPGLASINSPVGVDVSINTELSWTAGTDATLHEVLFGTDADNLVSTIQTGTSFTPSSLAYGTTYFWKVNEINDTGTTLGALWSFTTEEEILQSSASFVSQNIPASINAGETVSVNVTLNNAGTSTWTAADGYKLGSQNAQGNTTWGLNRVVLTKDVAPGSNHTFTFDVTAPTTATTYEFQWKMLQEGVQWFGDATTNVSVDVLSVPVENTLSESYFETDMDGWIDGDGAGDLVVRQVYASRAAEGEYSIKIKDNEGESSAVTSPAYDLSAYDEVSIDYQYYPHNQAGSDGFSVQYYDGAIWQTIASYVVDTDFVNGQFYAQTLTLSSADYAFPADAKFRFESNGLGGGRHIYIDAVIISAEIVDTNPVDPEPVECAMGESTLENTTHDCNYNPGGTAQGNFKMKYPGGEWISIGCSAGKPVADNSNTQWVRESRAIRIVGGDYLKCGELDQECSCNAGGGENFHGISNDYQGELGNTLTHAVDYPGGGFIFNNSGHQTCLGIHEQGEPGEIESIWSMPDGTHRTESGAFHDECPLFCLGDACPSD